MDDQRTMAQLLEAPTEGYEDAIVVPEINANFELKHGLINLVQNKQFFGHDKEDPHAHIRYFNKITSTMKFPNVPNVPTWDRFNDLLRGHVHIMDFLVATFWTKMPRDCLRIIESKSKVCNSRNKPVVAKVSSSSSTPGISLDVAELKDMVKALLLDKKSQAPTPVKAAEESCVTCGGAHSYRNCPATNGPTRIHLVGQLYDEVRARTLFVLSSSIGKIVVGIIDLMRQKEQRMKQKDLIDRMGKLQDVTNEGLND
ncbi:hypothetical protein Tco_1384909 [Tanacetum coccineum]